MFAKLVRSVGVFVRIVDSFVRIEFPVFNFACKVQIKLQKCNFVRVPKIRPNSKDSPALGVNKSD